MEKFHNFAPNFTQTMHALSEIMTPFQTIRQSLASDLKRVNDSIVASLESPNALMNSVINRYMEKKGKQIRPMLVILSARLLGEVTDNVVSGAVAVELLHNASLIHDDVVDDTLVRRGSPTINGLWDNHLAVLVGDFFLSTALLQGVDTGDVRIIDSISNLGRLLSIGELDEIYTAHANHLDEDAYFNIIYRKTASLFVSCVEVGAYGTGVDDHRLEILREYARLLGLCFQIKDDIFDYFSDEKIGKPTGNDLREGKITLPLLHVLTDESLPRHDEMLALARKDSLSEEEISILMSYAVENGGIEYAEAVMDRMLHEAVALMEQFPDCEARQSFIDLIHFIIERDS